MLNHLIAARVILLKVEITLDEPALLNCFSFEGPAPPEGPGHSPTSPSPQLEEMEPRFLEFEQEPPNWRDLATPEALSNLNKKEMKRQEVINGKMKQGRKLQSSLFLKIFVMSLTLYHLFLPCRVVCNRACSCANVKCASDGLLKALGEGRAPDLK